MREDLNQLYLVSAAGVAEMTADQFALAGVAEVTAGLFVLGGVAEITADRFALAGVAIDLDLEEEYPGQWELKWILLIQFGQERGR